MFNIPFLRAVWRPRDPVWLSLQQRLRRGPHAFTGAGGHDDPVGGPEDDLGGAHVCWVPESRNILRFNGAHLDAIYIIIYIGDFSASHV